MMRASTALARLGAVAPVGGRRARETQKWPLQVDADHRVPLLLGGAHEHAIAHEAGVVHHHVEAAEGVDAWSARARRPARKSATSAPLATASPPHGADLLTTSSGRRLELALAVERDAEVVDHDLRALAGELEGVRAADAATRAGDDDDASFTDPRSCRFPGIFLDLSAG